MNYQFFFRIYNFLYQLIQTLVDSIGTVRFVRKHPDTIVLIRVDGIGDFILWLESAKTLRKHFQDRKIILIANKIFVELAEKIGYFDQVIGVDLHAFTHDWRYRFNFLRNVSKLGAELAIQPTYARIYGIGDALIRATNAKERIGSVADPSRIRPWQRWIADRWYTKLIPAREGLLMEAKRNAQFLMGLGIENNAYAITKIPPLVKLSKSLTFEDDFFIIFPGAGNTKRMWSLASFAKVAQAVANEYGWRMIVCGSSAEKNIAQHLIGQTEIIVVHNLAGQTSLPEFVELVRNARLLIANETSAIHIAAAVSTPAVCLLGGGHFDRFMPYPEALTGLRPLAVFEHMDCFGCNWDCTLPYQKGNPVPCITAIQPPEVIDAVNSAIKKSGN